MFSYGLLDMDTPLLTDQEWPTYTSFVQALDAVLTFLVRWMIVTDD